MDYVDETFKIKTKEKLCDFISSLILELESTIDEIENTSIDRYLEALAAWLSSFENIYHNMKWKVPKNISWNVFASILLNRIFFNKAQVPITQRRQLVEKLNLLKNGLGVNNEDGISEVRSYLDSIVSVLKKSNFKENDACWYLIAQALEAALYYE